MWKLQIKSDINFIDLIGILQSKQTKRWITTKYKNISKSSK